MENPYESPKIEELETIVEEEHRAKGCFTSVECMAFVAILGITYALCRDTINSWIGGAYELIYETMRNFGDYF
ncbi:hypothetical protein GF386_01230 [Candidatus Pacearchaeota archaeon]|nr:hypothetical protein [Candidatus Pacearchaeota archaeon]